MELKSIAFHDWTPSMAFSSPKLKQVRAGGAWHSLQLLWSLLKQKMYLSLSLAKGAVSWTSSKLWEIQVNSSSLSDELLYQWVLICCKTISITHIKTYLSCGGLWLNIPANKAETFGCFLTDVPSMWTWYTEIADFKQFKVLYCNLYQIFQTGN